MKPIDPSVGGVLKATWRHKFVVATSTVVGFVLFTVAYLMFTPVYEASTTLLVGQTTGGDVSEGSKRPVELVASQARIAESEEVVRAAINAVGLEKLDFAQPGGSAGLGGWLRSWFTERKAGEPPKISPTDVAVQQLSRILAVRTEPNSDVMRIVFRHKDPAVAAAFANAVAEAFIERQIAILGRPGALTFINDQVSRFEREVKNRSVTFEDFVKKTNTFSVEDQRALLLKRSSDLTVTLATTRSTLADKSGQRAALGNQLRQLRPVTQSTYVSGLVDSLAGEDRGGRTNPSVGDRAASSDPPLLLVRVYQDSMVSLFKVNAEIEGLQRLGEQQQAEIRRVDAALATLASHQTEFERLKRDVALATYNAELYAKRAVQEQIDAALRDAKLSTVRVVQRALVPLQAVFPKGVQFAGLGLAFGLLMGVAAALLLEMFGADLRHAVLRR